MKPMLSEKTEQGTVRDDSDSDSCDSEGESAQMLATRQRTTGLGCLRPGSTGLFQLSPTPVANRFEAFNNDDEWADVSQAREVSKKLRGSWTPMEPEVVQEVKELLRIERAPR